MKHVARQIAPDVSTLGQLRSLLDATERQVVIMHETPNGARDVLQNIDQIDRLLDALDQPQFDTRAEEGRADSLRERLLNQAFTVERLVRRNGHAAALATSPLWQAVQAVATERRRRARQRWLIGGAAAAVIAVLLFVVLPWFFPPVPQADTMPIIQQAGAGNYAGALATANAERTRVPTDPEGALWAGALYFKQGDTDAANAAWQEAQHLFNDDRTFFFERGAALAQLGEFDVADADVQRLIGVPEWAAYGYYLRGTIAEAQGQNQQALQAYQEASTLADKANNPQLTVTARTRMGFLMQRGDFPTPSQ